MASAARTRTAAIRRLLPEPAAALGQWVHERGFLVKQRRRMRRLAAYHRPPADPDALLAAVRRKTLVFTVTAGRTGTVYLAELLGLFPDTTSLHEPEPAYVSVLRTVQQAPAAARAFLLEYKLPFIAAAPTTRYVETSHLFCKGFLEPALDLGLLPGFVCLRRAPRRIATSYLIRRAVPGRTKYGFKYLLHPGDNGVLPLPGWTRRSDYQLCFWYALEMERRQQAYAEALAARGAAWVDVTAEELHDPQCFFAAASALGLLDAGVDLDAIGQRHAARSAVVHNPNRGRPRPALDYSAEEEAVWAAVGPVVPGLRERIAARYAPRAARAGGEPA